MKMIMKKIITALLTSSAILLTACHPSVEKIDSIQSNIGNNNMDQVMETDIGYYYNSLQYSFYGDPNPLSLMYYDKDTGKSIYLCAKPECQHDGSSFCPATNSDIKVFNTLLYGDYIYITGKENEIDVSIYRAKNDGTELTKLVDCIKSSGNNEIIRLEAFLVHRGKAYIAYRTFDQYNRGINSIIITVDLSTLKCKQIDEIDFTNNYIITNIKASDDYVYYMVLKEHSNMSTIKRYNIVDHTLEEVPLPYKNGYAQNLYIYGYVIIGNEIWISCKTFENGNGIEKKYMAYDLKSGEMRETIKRKREDSEVRYVTESYKMIENELMYDGKYMYISELNWDDIDYNRNFTMLVFDLNGTYLAKFPVEFNNSFESAFYNMNVIKDTVYLQTEYELKSCSVQDIIDGNFAWTTIFQFDH